MSTPQIIRTQKELKELDLETVLMDEHGEYTAADLWADEDQLLAGQGYTILPLVVIASGDQVRAARKALQGEA